MVCHNCGIELSAGARFCRHCGAPVQETIERTLPAVQLPVEEPKTIKKGRGRRVFLSLLLFCIFAGGLAVSVWYTIRTMQKYNTPYREDDFAALNAALAKADDSAAEILRLEALLAASSAEVQELEDTLALHRASREREILDTITDTVELDYDALFHTEPFASAYLQYIEDLLNAFRQDAQIDSWLYPYYTYSVEYGANTYINEDLWIYRHYDDSTESEENAEKFNPVLSEPAFFYIDSYTNTLTGHAARNGHLYVTGLDMLNTLFQIPGYVLDGAVFVKAYGGNPAPQEMEVPGWAPQDYNNFWQYAGSYLYSEHAVWVDYGLSAEDFALDWNTLTDEKAYYKAYEKFMDAIAPGLDRYAPAQYVADDEYYGGIRCELSGNEATLQEIAAAYIADNPACLKELGIDTAALPSSFDGLIADAETRLEELADTAEQLETQKNQAQRQLDSRDFLLQQQEALSAIRDRHLKELSVLFWVFVLISVFLFLMTAVSLKKFLRSLA